MILHSGATGFLFLQLHLLMLSTFHHHDPTDRGARPVEAATGNLIVLVAPAAPDCTPCAVSLIVRVIVARPDLMSLTPRPMEYSPFTLGRVLAAFPLDRPATTYSRAPPF